MSNLNASYMALRQPFKRNIADVSSPDGSLSQTERCGKLPRYQQGPRSCRQFKIPYPKTAQQQWPLQPPVLKQQELQQRTEASTAMLMIVNHLQQSRTAAQAGLPVSLEEIETAARLIHQQQKRDGVSSSDSKACWPGGQQPQQQQHPEAARDTTAPVQLLSPSICAGWSAPAAAMVPMAAGLVSPPLPAGQGFATPAAMSFQSTVSNGGSFFPGQSALCPGAVSLHAQAAGAVGALATPFTASATLQGVGEECLMPYAAQQPAATATMIAEQALDLVLGGCQVPSAAQLLLSTGPMPAQYGHPQQLLLEDYLQHQQQSFWQQGCRDSLPLYSSVQACQGTFTQGTQGSDMSGSEATVQVLELSPPQPLAHPAAAAAADTMLEDAMFASNNSLASVNDGSSHSNNNSSSSGEVAMVSGYCQPLPEVVASTTAAAAAAAATAASNGGRNDLSWDRSCMEDWMCGSIDLPDDLLLLVPDKELQALPAATPAAAAMPWAAGVSASDALLDDFHGLNDMSFEDDLIVKECMAAQVHDCALMIQV